MLTFECVVHFYVFFKLHFRERGKERMRQRNTDMRNVVWLPLLQHWLVAFPTYLDQGLNPKPSPDWESNLQLYLLQHNSTLRFKPTFTIFLYFSKFFIFFVLFFSSAYLFKHWFPESPLYFFCFIYSSLCLLTRCKLMTPKFSSLTKSGLSSRLQYWNEYWNLCLKYPKLNSLSYLLHLPYSLSNE